MVRNPGKPNGAESRHSGERWESGTAPALKTSGSSTSEQPRHLRNATTRHFPLPTEQFGVRHPGEDTD